MGLVSFAYLMVVFMMFLNFAVLLSGRLHLIYKIAFIIGIAAFFQAGKVFLDIMSVTDAKQIAVVLKGNTGNINILSASLLFKVPFIFIALLHYSSFF